MRASIVIPVFNGAAFIRESVESALSQVGIEDFEVVVLDNASTDRTLAVIDSFRNDPRLRVVSMEEHVSMPENFNRALAASSGDIIRFLCHDDLIAPECLRISVETLEANPEVMIFTSYERFINSGDRVRDAHQIPHTGFVSGAKARRSLLFRGNWIGGPSGVTLRRPQLTSKGLFNPELPCCFDIGTWLDLLSEGDLFVSTEFLYGSRIHPGQATNKCNQGGFKKDWYQIIGSLRKPKGTIPIPLRLYARIMNSLNRL